MKKHGLVTKQDEPESASQVEVEDMADQHMADHAEMAGVGGRQRGQSLAGSTLAKLLFKLSFIHFWSSCLCLKELQYLLVFL